MSTKENKEQHRRILEEVYNKRNLAVVDELIAPNYVINGPMGETKGPENYKQGATAFLTAFPDLHVTVDDMIAEGDKVSLRFTFTGTHKGELSGIAPTGKKVAIKASLFARFAGGKEVEAFEFFDTLAFYQQLGITPPKG